MAETAALHDYCRPEIDDAPRLKVTGGRHPVVEQTLIDERFVPYVEAGGAAGD